MQGEGPQRVSTRRHHAGSVFGVAGYSDFFQRIQTWICSESSPCYGCPQFVKKGQKKKTKMRLWYPNKMWPPKNQAHGLAGTLRWKSACKASSTSLKDQAGPQECPWLSFPICQMSQLGHMLHFSYPRCPESHCVPGNSLAPKQIIFTDNLKPATGKVFCQNFHFFQDWGGTKHRALFYILPHAYYPYMTCPYYMDILLHVHDKFF